MTASIWKFPLTMTDRIELAMPRDAKPLSVQMQNGQWCLWAHIPDVDAEKEQRVFQWHGTGNPCPRHPGTFVATVQMNHGALVLHLFDRGNGRISV